MDTTWEFVIIDKIDNGQNILVSIETEGRVDGIELIIKFGANECFKDNRIVFIVIWYHDLYNLYKVTYKLVINFSLKIQPEVFSELV